MQRMQMRGATAKKAFLVAVLLIEGLLLTRSLQREAPILRAFLTKTGSRYRLVWRSPANTLESLDFDTLQEATHRAQLLHLREGRSLSPWSQVEFVSVEERFGEYVLYWKLSPFAFLHQLTFQNKKEALFFAEAFRHNAYSPSPYGHSILLLPATGSNGAVSN